MIADHLEPKGLDRDTPAIINRYPDRHRAKATSGSQRLLNAILKARGIEVQRPPAPVFTRPPKVRLARPRKNRANPQIAAIQAIVAEHYGLRIDDLSAVRRRTHARERQVAMFLAWETTSASFPDIAWHFCRDHTTVMHGVAVIQAKLQAGDSGIITAVETIRDRLSQ